MANEGRTAAGTVAGAAPNAAAGRAAAGKKNEPTAETNRFVRMFRFEGFAPIHGKASNFKCYKDSKVAGQANLANAILVIMDTAKNAPSGIPVRGCRCSLVRDETGAKEFRVKLTSVSRQEGSVFKPEDKAGVEELDAFLDLLTVKFKEYRKDPANRAAISKSTVSAGAVSDDELDDYGIEGI